MPQMVGHSPARPSLPAEQGRSRCNQQRNMRMLSAWRESALLALVAVCLRAPGALAAPLVEHFSRADGEAYVEAAARALGDAGSSLADKDYAVRLLGALDNPSVASGYKSSACSAAAAGLSSGDLEQIHHAISLGKGVGGCTNAKSWRASEEVAEAMKVCSFVCGCRVVRLRVWGTCVGVCGGYLFYNPKGEDQRNALRLYREEGGSVRPSANRARFGGVSCS